MQELKCPECGTLNPDIREIGYTLPFTCGQCRHIWRLQDLMPAQAPMPADMAKALAGNLWSLYERGDDSKPPNVGGEATATARGNR